VTVPLTDAEKAAAEVLFHLSETSGEWHAPHWTVDDFADEARAVVAAVQPLIAEETLRETADYLYEHRRDGDDGAFNFWQMYEAGGPEWLSSRATAARQSLSRPTSEETPDAR